MGKQLSSGPRTTSSKLFIGARLTCGYEPYYGEYLMVDWKDYDVPPEPKVTLRDEITPMRRMVPVGRLAIPYNREASMAFVKKVERGDPPEDPVHYYNNADGYAISQDIIEQLELNAVELVFTYEEDTGTVHEHAMEDYTESVDNGRYGKDEQYAASEHDALWTWNDLAEDLFTNKSFWSKQ